MYNASDIAKIASYGGTAIGLGAAGIVTHQDLPPMPWWLAVSLMIFGIYGVCKSCIMAQRADRGRSILD